MKLFIQLNCFLAWTFKCSFAWRETPRLILNQDQDNTTLRYPIHQNHTVFFHPDDSDDLYVGGTGFVFQMDVQNCRVIEALSVSTETFHGFNMVSNGNLEFTLNTTGEQTCTKGPCENVITVIQHFQDSLFVCGTNGHKPQCWKLYSQIDNQTYQIVESYEGIGISPHIYIHNSVSLTVEGDLYAAAPFDSDGSSLQFRRIAGSRTNVWMYDTWVSEPTFISANWIKRSDDPKNEKIYVFFREKNSDNSPEADPWISRVARVCKIDEGGSKRFFQNIWTSFLKARLVCGIPKESLYFNRLQDIYVLHSENWEDSRVYGLFTSSWNSTAVCIYSMKDIDNIFENSTFKGFDKEIPNPRPGKCVSNSKNLPLDTINVVKDHPEMSDWIHSIRPHVPFYISSNNYTKIAVDRVQAADEHMHNVLLLATDSGKIHKVLEDGSEPFIISEIQPINHSAIIRSIKLESAKRKLVVGFSEQITVLDLESCQDYNKSCEDCVLARDPYCAWSKYGCTPTVLGSVQNILDGRTGMCPKTTEEPKNLNRTKRETQPPSSEPLTAVHEVPANSPFYLSCPIDSYHAVYTWEQGGHSKPCLPMQANCLHLIPAMAPEHYGDYKCVSKERDYNKTVKAYQLNPSRNLRSVSILNGSSNVKAETALFNLKTLLSILSSFFLTSRLHTCMLPC